jgi:hypothetical protein
MKANPLALAAVATCLASGAQADSVTYTGSFSGLTDVTNQVINVSQFDASLGTLQSASFTLGATMGTSVFAINDGDFYVRWDKTVYSLSLTGAAPYGDIAMVASDPAKRVLGSGAVGSSGALNTYQHLTQLSNPNTWTFAGPTLSASQSFAEGALGAFVGGGNLSFFLNTLNEDTLSVAGLQTGGLPAPATSGLSTSISSSVSVTYIYSPVPEPASYAMLLAGLLGIAPLIRRRLN